MDVIHGENGAREHFQAQAQVWSYTYNYMKSLSLKPLNVHPNKTRCTQILVCLLAHSGFFVQQKDGKNEQEEESILLPPHLDFFSRISLQLQGSTILLLIADATFTTSFHFLSTWLQNDDQTLFGTADGIFYEAMITDFELIASVLIEDCNEVSKGLKPLVDVGGSTGTMARAIATAFPDTKCTVFIFNNYSNLTKLTNQLTWWILHDWSDEESLKILKKCKESTPSTDEGGKVIIIDVAIAKPNERQRNNGDTTIVCDWKKLFLAAGFSHYKITPNLGLWSLIEAYP
ncbi:O-methyltransferase ZRP4 [Citrus sinensis]|uniref:O-methyltransferase ZRP4 n=1 Tax=Citrus sinensis TaxID=2711 RepID=A0ACB8K9L0_CITSI|nr:O-methyltransferase ZRP4 [Citrus sinensis]